MALSWIAVLLLAASTQNGWYLFAIGDIGTIQNVFAASWRRNPSALGVYLDFVEVVGKPKVMDALLARKRKYRGAGTSLLPIFFPGGIHPEETLKFGELNIQ